jgi:hypothetical protein
MASAKDRRKLSLNDLMGQLGHAHPGSAVRPGLEAEFDRRKFIWQIVTAATSSFDPTCAQELTKEQNEEIVLSVGVSQNVIEYDQNSDADALNKEKDNFTNLSENIEVIARPNRFGLLTPRFVVWCSLTLPLR